MNWVKVFPESEFPEGERRVVKLEDHSILIIRENGKLYALDSACPHMRFSLKGGRITEDEAIVCPLHHSAFDLNTGDVKDWTPWPPLVGKMMGALVREHALHVYPTRIEEGSIWIEL